MYIFVIFTTKSLLSIPILADIWLKNSGFQYNRNANATVFSMHHPPWNSRIQPNQGLVIGNPGP